MVIVLPCTTSDLDALRHLVLDLHETLRPFDPDLAPVEIIPDIHFRELVARVEETAGGIFVAEQGSHLVGYVCVWGSVAPDDADERPDPYSFMAELFVRPECRGTGIGRRLVERAEALARTHGRYKMELNVLAGNQAALRFYEALGYEPRMVVLTKRM
jgi:ribosomal protein S18 acetylase RimI-like enzyme